jgi:hypothetical protein
MDYLVAGDYLFVKTDQPDWSDRQKWSEIFELD